MLAICLSFSELWWKTCYASLQTSFRNSRLRLRVSIPVRFQIQHVAGRVCRRKSKQEEYRHPLQDFWRADLQRFYHRQHKLDLQEPKEISQAKVPSIPCENLMPKLGSPNGARKLFKCHGDLAIGITVHDMWYMIIECKSFWVIIAFSTFLQVQERFFTPMGSSRYTAYCFNKILLQPFSARSSAQPIGRIVSIENPRVYTETQIHHEQHMARGAKASSSKYLPEFWVFEKAVNAHSSFERHLAQGLCWGFWDGIHLDIWMLSWGFYGIPWFLCIWLAFMWVLQIHETCRF